VQTLEVHALKLYNLPFVCRPLMAECGRGGSPCLGVAARIGMRVKIAQFAMTVAASFGMAVATQV
jgi:hypothetical protein